MTVWTKALFALDALPDQVFEGYSTGEQWNGWACPYFERDQAEAVLRASEANRYTWQYHIDTDTFVVQSLDDPNDYEPENFHGLNAQIDGVETVLYGIGANAWIWEEIDHVRN